MALILALVIGCGGSGGGTSVAGTATTSTTATTTTSATTSTTSSTGTIPAGTLPPNVIFYVDSGGANALPTNFSNYDVYYVSPTGTGQALYVTVPSNVAAACSNPSVQGQFIFAATTDGTNYNIYSNTSLSTTGAKTIVSANQVGVDAITISADGNNVYFSAEDANGDEAIYKVPSTGGTPNMLFLGDEPEVDGSNTYLAFDQYDPNLPNNEYIFYSKLDGSGVTQVTSGNAAQDSAPQWSKPTSATPTPNLITFTRITGPTNLQYSDIFVANVTTKALTQITTSPLDSTANPPAIDANTALVNAGSSFSPDNSLVSFEESSIDSSVNSQAPAVYTASATTTSPIAPTPVTGSATVQSEPIATIGGTWPFTSTYWTGYNGRSAGAVRAFEFRRKHAKHTRHAAKK